MVVLLLPPSSAMDDGEFDHSGGGGGGGGPVAAAASAVVVAVDDRHQWWWHLMAVAALDRGHATTSQCSKRVAQGENKRAAQEEAMKQPANLLPRCIFDMGHCHLLCCHGITWHRCLQRRHGNTWHCLWLCSNCYGEEEGDGNGDGGGT